jgi:excisionase family DNA binding protein
MERNNTNSLVFTVEQAGELLGLSRGLTYEAIRTGQIPSIRIGRRILIPKAALLRLLDEAGTTNSIKPISKLA